MPYGKARSSRGCEMKHKQGDDIYLVLSIGNLDELIDTDDEVPRTFDSAKDALKEAREIVDEYGLHTYVYHCVPIYSVGRGKPRVTKLKPEV